MSQGRGEQQAIATTVHSGRRHSRKKVLEMRMAFRRHKLETHAGLHGRSRGTASMRISGHSGTLLHDTNVKQSIGALLPMLLETFCRAKDTSDKIGKCNAKRQCKTHNGNNLLEAR